MQYSFQANVAQLAEQQFRKLQVKGSSPFIGSIIFRGVAQFGSAFGSGLKGRRFKSCHPDHEKARLCPKDKGGLFRTKRSAKRNVKHPSDEKRTSCVKISFNENRRNA